MTIFASPERDDLEMAVPLYILSAPQVAACDTRHEIGREATASSFSSPSEDTHPLVTSCPPAYLPTAALSSTARPAPNFSVPLAQQQQEQQQRQQPSPSPPPPLIEDEWEASDEDEAEAEPDEHLVPEDALVNGLVLDADEGVVDIFCFAGVAELRAAPRLAAPVVVAVRGGDGLVRMLDLGERERVKGGAPRRGGKRKGKKVCFPRGLRWWRVRGERVKG